MQPLSMRKFSVLRMKILSAVTIYLGFLGLIAARHDLELKVHAVGAISLFFGFFIPALFVKERREIIEKKVVLVPMLLGSILTWDFLMSLVIVKGRFLDGAILYIPVGMLGLSGLLFGHSLICDLLNKLKSRTRHLCEIAGTRGATDSTV